MIEVFEHGDDRTEKQSSKKAKSMIWARNNGTWIASSDRAALGCLSSPHSRRSSSSVELLSWGESASRAWEASLELSIGILDFLLDW
jgi:hypothetical protein